MLLLTDGETLLDLEMLRLGDIDRLALKDIDRLGLALTLVIPRLNTNMPTSVSWLARRPDISGVPVELATNMVLLKTVRTPLPPTVPALTIQGDDGNPSTPASLFTTQQANARVSSVTVVTAGAAGLVSFCRLAHAPEPVSKSTSSGLLMLTLTNEPHHQPTGSFVPADVNS